jgi:hypothetical protein
MKMPWEITLSLICGSRSPSAGIFLTGTSDLRAILAVGASVDPPSLIRADEQTIS